MIRIPVGDSVVIGYQNITSSLSGNKALNQQFIYPYPCRMIGEIIEHQDALDFQAGVNDSRSLRTVRYSLDLKFYSSVEYVFRIKDCTDKTERQTFFAGLLNTTSTVTDLRYSAP